MPTARVTRKLTPLAFSTRLSLLGALPPNPLFLYIHSLISPYIFIHSLISSYIFIHSLITSYVFIHSLISLYAFIHSLISLPIFIHNHNCLSYSIYGIYNTGIYNIYCLARSTSLYTTFCDFATSSSSFQIPLMFDTEVTLDTAT